MIKESLHDWIAAGIGLPCESTPMLTLETARQAPPTDMHRLPKP